MKYACKDIKRLNWDLAFEWKIEQIKDFVQNQPTSSNISSSSTSFSSPRTVAKLARLALEILEPIVGEVAYQFGSPTLLIGEEALESFLER